MSIKDTLIHTYQVAEIEEKYEGILWLQLKHKSNNTLIGMCVCYLPPATSSRGDFSQEYIDTLKQLIIETITSVTLCCVVILMLDVETCRKNVMKIDSHLE